MFIDYTATRELVGSGDDEIESAPADINRQMKSKGSDSDSMSGVNRESNLERLEFVWVVTSIPEHIDTQPRWREFAASTANRETFSFDPFGTKASPDNVLTVSMIRGSYKETRLGGPYVQYSFEVLER